VKGRKRSVNQGLGIELIFTKQEKGEALREEGLHKAVLDNPLFEERMVTVFNPHVQVPHDVLHSEQLGISKKLARLVADMASESSRNLIDRRIEMLARAKMCQCIKIRHVGTWNGRDLRQFIRVAPVVCSGVPGLTDLLIECLLAEAQVMWYLTCPDWNTVLEADFQETYERQRSVSQAFAK
jgi:hypothetical protein